MARRSTLRTLERTRRLLQAFRGAEPLGLSELARRTGLPLATVHRLARAMTAEGFLRHDPTDRTYALGWRIPELSAAMLRAHAIRRVGHPVLLNLRNRTRESAQLAVLDGTHIVILDTEESYAFVREITTPGQRTPAHALSTGKVLMAHLPAAHLQALLRRGRRRAFTPKTITAADDLRREFARIRRQGFALADEEYEEGVIGIAAPIFDRWGRAVAAISVGGPRGRILPRLDAIVAHVRRAAQAVTRALPWQ
ncbi:MAG: IclR family transcriptional regulator [Armatimonadota bacterium]|nr:IclR family transcriptional regulator [Armatimonadota bacterium]MDR7420904.1 IclR family transcriptional regulator [Armatimonadota bacterium]MDR7453642.1 IclR family transcriptional regulator [Armatimonadota bacterium]MDR7457148.1 IclR family transcriptional regulator [Armatimonadota bacterium]MDR7497111.1 IclR family transcriptional regulator [Armatimonadota bacterium]